uniref:Protein tweety homolog n=1 Tax=Oncorhynchus tshawytscha TaxID=74940 RepID=A0A8C8CFK9_ONCTS
MSSIRDDYIAPWWTYWLHNFPHVNLNFQPIDNTFSPQDQNYQQSLIFLGCVAAAGLGLNLLCLAIYLSCLCCCRKDEDEESKRPNSCCVTWSAVVAGLISCAAVGVGFYGNSETNDGVYQLTYSLYNANHTLGGVDNLVTNTMGSMESGLKQHLARLDEIFATRGDYVQTLRFMQQMADNVIKQLLGLPDWDTAKVDLAAVADQTAYVEYYRYRPDKTTYRLCVCACMFVCVCSCLWACVSVCVRVCELMNGWACVSVCGTSDFCVIPDKFIMNQTKDLISSGEIWPVVLCACVCLQSLTIFQRSLTTMQIQIQGLLQFAVPLFPTAERDLLGIQHLLNSSEASLHQLTALLDCRGLNKDYLDALIGVCYDGVEGLLYLCLFSILAICAFCAMLCAIPRAWTHIASRERDYDDIDEEDPFNPQARRMTTHNPNHATNVHSFCSYSSSMGSQSSLHPPAAQAGSNAPVSEYMNQSALFGGNQRYENVPLIGRGSPPPSYSPSMRATYLSMTEDQIRHFGNDFQA